MRTVLIFSLFILSTFVFAQPGLADEIPDNGARYLSHTANCYIKGNGFEITYKEIIKIYNTKGQEYTTVVVNENKNSKLKNVKIVVKDSNGDEVYTQSKKDMTKQCGYDGISIYTDNCTYFLDVSAPQFPYIIEYEYTLEYKSLFFLHGLYFDRDIPIDYASYTLTYPAGFHFEYELHDIELTETIEATSKGMVQKWEGENIPALRRIKYLPRSSAANSRLKIAASDFEFENYKLNDLSWEEIGHWYNRMAEEKYLSYNQSAPVNKPSMEEIYNQVINDIRYVAITIGIGGWQPFKAELTRERGFGDCKDMTTLLISNLRQNGFTAYPVLVMTRDSGPTDVEFPETRFNHVITMAISDNDTIWMDPTSNNSPYGELPSGDEYIDVLVIDNSGGHIIKSPASTAEQNLISMKTDYYLNENLFYNFSVEAEIIGNQALYYQSWLEGADKEEEKEFLENIFETSKNNIEIKSYGFKNLDSIHLPLILNLTGKSKKKTDKLGSKIYFDPYHFCKPHGREKIKLKDRKHPVSFSYPYTNKDIITLSWSDQISVDSLILPPEDSLVFDFGSLRVSSSRGTNSATINFEKKYHVYEISIEQLEQYREFCAKYRKMTSKMIKLLNK